MKLDDGNPSHIGKRIHIISNRIKRRMDREIASFGLTRSQHVILRYLQKNSDKDIFQKYIEEEFDLRRSTVSSMLTHLEQKGYVQRESVSYDARLKKITITPAGCHILETMCAVVDNFEKRIEAALTPNEISMLFDILDKLWDITDDKEEEEIEK